METVEELTKRLRRICHSLDSSPDRDCIADGIARLERIQQAWREYVSSPYESDGLHLLALRNAIEGDEK